MNESAYQSIFLKTRPMKIHYGPTYSFTNRKLLPLSAQHHLAVLTGHIKNELLYKFYLRV